MKLKNLAALLLRMFGAMMLLSGLGDTVFHIADHNQFDRIFVSLCELGVSVGLIYYSKKLGELFSRGLED